MFSGLLVAALLSTPGVRSIPAFCDRPVPTVDRMICNDPRLTAWAKASIHVQADFAAVDPEAVEAAQDTVNWPATLNACVDKTCVRDAYADWVSVLLEDVPPRFPIRGARRLSREGSSAKTWNRLELLQLGDGWMFFRLAGQYTRFPSLPPFFGGASGVFRLEDDRASSREKNGSGFDFQRQANGTWRVIQIGDCPCGAHVTLDGVYR